MKTTMSTDPALHTRAMLKEGTWSAKALVGRASLHARHLLHIKKTFLKKDTQYEASVSGFFRLVFLTPWRTWSVWRRRCRSSSVALQVAPRVLGAEWSVRSGRPGFRVRVPFRLRALASLGLELFAGTPGASRQSEGLPWPLVWLRLRLGVYCHAVHPA